MGPVRFGRITWFFDRPTVSLWPITLYNPGDSHGSFCHSSPTQRLSLLFCPLHWLTLNLPLRMAVVPRPFSQNRLEIRKITLTLTAPAIPCTLCLQECQRLVTHAPETYSPSGLWRKKKGKIMSVLCKLQKVKKKKKKVRTGEWLCLSASRSADELTDLKQAGLGAKWDF